MNLHKRVFPILFLLLVTLFAGTDDKFQEYKALMSGSSSGPLRQTDKATSSKSSLPLRKGLNEEIREIESLKQGTFESTSDFINRRNGKIQELDNKIKFFSGKGSREYSAGIVTMKKYDADKEIMVLNLSWNRKIKKILPEGDSPASAVMNIPRGEAQKLFEKRSAHYFHINIDYERGKIKLARMSLYDKFILKRKEKKIVPLIRKRANIEPVGRSTMQRVSSQKSLQKKYISFSENGIDIFIVYPDQVQAGEKFIINAKMTNLNRKAKQGGLTLSFPDMGSLAGKPLDYSFTTLKGYSYPDKIYSREIRGAMRTRYFMIEGWQERRWSHGETKYFSVELTAPRIIGELKVNVRGILWIRNSHDTRKIPSSSLVNDQQGFPVKQFLIKIKHS